MANSLVLIEGKTTYTTSRIIADGCKLKHHAVIELVKKYRKRIGRVGDLEVEMRSFLPVSKRGTLAGRPGEEALLSEIQATFLITLMRNSEVVLGFKEKLTVAFFQMRNVLANLASQKSSSEWLDMRMSGKIVHRKKTNAIKRFVEYATVQGSQSADKYYVALAKMENSALFFLEQKFKNVRKALVVRQLLIASMADDVIKNALDEGMEKKLDYRDCYQLAKRRVFAFADVVKMSTVFNLELKHPEENAPLQIDHNLSATPN